MPNTMPQWNDTYSLGVNSIDLQHKHLFEIYNKIIHLDMSLEIKRVTNPILIKKEIRTVLHELNEYLKTHFKDEEAFMLKIGFPELEDHKLKHEKIIDIVSSTISHNHRLNTIKTKMHFIAKRTLVEHILHEDMKIKTYQDSLRLNKVHENGIFALD